MKKNTKKITYIAVAVIIMCGLVLVGFHSLRDIWSAETPEGFLSGNIVDNSHWGITVNSQSRAGDNVAAFNKMFQSASQNQMKDVKLSSGTYYIDGQRAGMTSRPGETIEVPSNIHFNLGGATLRQIPNSSPHYAMLTLNEQTNVKISNGTLIGDATEHNFVQNTEFKTHEFGFGIEVRSGNNIELADLDIYNMTGDSIIVAGLGYYLRDGSIPEDIRIINSKLHDSRRQGLSIIGGRNMEIRGCTIYGIGEVNGTAPKAGIDLENEIDWPIEDIRIIGNHITENKYGDSYTIVVQRGSNDVTIAGNTLIGALALIDGNNIVVSGNQMTNGLIESSGKNTLSLVNITGNTFTNSDVYMLRVPSVSVSNNLFINSVVRYRESNGVVYGNTFRVSSRYDFAINLQATEPISVIVFGNILEPQGTSGEFIRDVLIEGTNSRDNVQLTRDEQEAQKYLAQFKDPGSIPQTPPPNQNGGDSSNSRPTPAPDGDSSNSRPTPAPDGDSSNSTPTPTPIPSDGSKRVSYSEKLWQVGAFFSSISF